MQAPEQEFDLDELDPLFRAVAWQAGRLEWKLHAAQQIIHESIEELPSNVKEGVVLCSRRFGKSFYGAIRSVMKCIRYSHRVQRIIGPEVKQTRDIVRYNMAKITRELPELGLRDLVRWRASDNMFEVGDGSGIFLGGYDSQEDNQRGGEADEILIEETGSSNPDHYSYQMRDVLKPQLLKTRGKLLHLTTLPPVPDHPFTLETIPQAQLDGAFYSYNIYQDPLATPEIIADAIKDCGGEHTDAFRREYKNEQIRDRSLVIIPDYDDTLDVEEIVAPGSCNLELFTDWGGVRDFTVSLLMTYDYLRACDYVLDELWWPNNTPTDDIKLAMARKWGRRPIKNWYADAAGQTLVDLNRDEFERDLKIAMRDDNLPVVRLPKKDDFESAVNNMANRVRHRKVKIHPQCKLLRATCRSGVLNKNRTDFDRSKTLGHMDAAAALMYGIRCLDRTNPYPVDVPQSNWVWTPPQRDQSNVQSMVRVPKSFGAKGIRRFGA